MTQSRHVVWLLVCFVLFCFYLTSFGDGKSNDGVDEVRLGSGSGWSALTWNSQRIIKSVIGGNREGRRDQLIYLHSKCCHHSWIPLHKLSTPSHIPFASERVLYQASHSTWASHLYRIRFILAHKAVLCYIYARGLRATKELLGGLKSLTLNCTSEQ